MKEKRVYIIFDIDLDSHLQDRFGGEDHSYNEISDSDWMTIAEREGWVYTFEGFVKAWESDPAFPESRYSHSRIIEVEC